MPAYTSILLYQSGNRQRRNSTCIWCTIRASVHIHTCPSTFSRRRRTTLSLVCLFSWTPPCSQPRSALNYMTSPWNLRARHQVLDWIGPSYLCIDQVRRLPCGPCYFRHINDGLLCQLGNDNSTNLWIDRWLVEESTVIFLYFCARP